MISISGMCSAHGAYLRPLVRSLTVPHATGCAGNRVYSIGFLYSKL